MGGTENLREARLSSASRHAASLDADAMGEAAYIAQSGGAAERDANRPGGPLGISKAPSIPETSEE